MVVEKKQKMWKFTDTLSEGHTELSAHAYAIEFIINLTFIL